MEKFRIIEHDFHLNGYPEIRFTVQKQSFFGWWSDFGYEFATRHKTKEDAEKSIKKYLERKSTYIIHEVNNL